MREILTELFSLEGRRAVVTGASRGIGRAIAEALAGAGADVLLHYNRSAEQAQAVADAIRAAGGSAQTAQADLTKTDEVTRLFKKVADLWDGLDILVNNAGDLVQRTKIEDLTDELLEQVVRVNLHSAIYATRAAIPMLRKQTHPSIINISSIAAHNGGANGATLYAATKGALLTMTRGLAKEVAPDIRVNAIAPGVVMTDFHRTHSTEEGLKTIGAATPLKRLGQPEDHAAAAIFLAGAGASFITGEMIEVNGGLWLA